MKKRVHPVWKILFYFFIGDTFAQAIHAQSKGLFIVATLGLFIGLCWIYPLFIPED